MIIQASHNMSTEPPRLVIAEISRISHVCVPTVKKYLRGEPVKHITALLIRSALMQMGRPEEIRA